MLGIQLRADVLVQHVQGFYFKMMIIINPRDAASVLIQHVQGPRLHPQKCENLIN